MFKSKGWVIATALAAALLPAPSSVQASELVKLAKLLTTGKRAAAPAATAETAKPVPRQEQTGERWTPPRAAEPAAAVRVSTAEPVATPAEAAPTSDWQGQDRGESNPPPAPRPVDANPSRGDRLEAAAPRNRNHG